VIPLRDANPVRRTPIVTIAIIVACIAAYAFRLGIEANAGQGDVASLFVRFGLVPARLTAAIETGQWSGDIALSLVTHMFLHVSLLHLGGNMLYLWIFGNNIEDRLGRLGFIVFYLVGGLAAAAAQVLISPHSEVPMVGASGAISALLGAYLVLWPGARILSLVFLGFFYQLIEIPALFVLGFWFLLQLVDGIGSLGVAAAEGGVAFFAHIGGFVAGVAVGLILRARAGGPDQRPGWSPAGPSVG
jgi:membrane associated rhomboid family serine protease